MWQIYSTPKLRKPLQVFHCESDYKNSLVAAKGNLHNFLKRQSSDELPLTSPIFIKKQSVVVKVSEKTSQSVVVTELEHPEQSSSRSKYDSGLEEVKTDIGKIKYAQGKILELLSRETERAEIKEEANQSFDFTLNNCKGIDDILSNIDWIVMADDSTDLVRCLICTKGNVKKGMSGTFCLNQDFPKVKFIIKEHIKRESHIQKLAESKFCTASL